MMGSRRDSFDEVLDAAVAAAPAFAALDGHRRAEFLSAIADALDDRGTELVATADHETSLGETRLNGELARTTGQLRRFAALVEDGSWAGARIDTGPPDVRRLLVPLGPVAVFGASNFPLAFSVPGGDTASALAAGCPVVCKAHPAHPATSALAADAVGAAVQHCRFDAGVFALLSDTSVRVGELLVADDRIEAVAFTGSHVAGRALFDIAARRPRLIPVYAEMGSINPVFVLPGAVAERGAEIAAELGDSVNLGVGQFCTKPGAIVTTAGDFIDSLTEAMTSRSPATMLTPGIADHFVSGVTELIASGATLLAGAAEPGQPALVIVDAEQFSSHAGLRREVFGPVIVIVEAPTVESMLTVARSLEGQLTATVYATDDELADHAELLRVLSSRAGRVIANGVPTGVAVNHAIHHGGPYPASTDSRATSVGTAAIERFVRPVCYQNLPDSALPPLLQDANPIGAWRLLDGTMTRQPLARR